MSSLSKKKNMFGAKSKSIKSNIKDNKKKKKTLRKTIIDNKKNIAKGVGVGVGVGTLAYLTLKRKKETQKKETQAYQCYRIPMDGFCSFWSIDKVLGIKSKSKLINKHGDEVPLSLWEICNYAKYQLLDKDSVKDLRNLKKLLDDRSLYDQSGMPTEVCGSGELVTEYINKKSEGRIQCDTNLFSIQHNNFEQSNLEYPRDGIKYTYDDLINLTKSWVDPWGKWSNDDLANMIKNKNFYLTSNSGAHWEVIMPIGK